MFLLYFSGTSAPRPFSSSFGLLTSLLLFTFLLTGPNVWAQDTPPIRRCAADEVQEELMKVDPAYREFVLQAKQATGTKVSANRVIPVVFVVYNLGEAVGTGTNLSDAFLQYHLDRMNQVYAAQGNYSAGVDTKIQFVLAQRTPNCAAFNGIVRYNASGVSGYTNNGITSYSDGNNLAANFPYANAVADQFITIRVVTKMTGALNNTGGFASTGRDIFVRGDNVGLGYTGLNYELLAHEMGHVLNLAHTFQGSTQSGGVYSCPVNTNPSSDGDGVADTDPHKADDIECSLSAATNVCTGQPFGKLTINVMNYACDQIFTSGQADRMQTMLAGSLINLSNSNAATAPASNEALTAAACTPTVTYAAAYYNTGISRFVFNTIDYSSSVYIAPGGQYSDYSCAQKTTIRAGNTYPVQIYTYNPQNSRVYIDYNNNGAFDETTEKAFATTSTGVGTITIPQSAVTNTYLRVRVVSDGGNNANLTACFIPGQPTYGAGEAEDYSVLIQPASCTPPTSPTMASGPITTCVGTTFQTSVACPVGTTAVVTSGPGSISAGVLSVTAIAAGTYSISVVCSLSATCNSTPQSLAITLNPTPTGSPTVSATSLIGCLNNPLSLTASCPAGQTLVGDSSSLTVVGTTVSLPTSQTGLRNYSVYCTNANGCVNNTTGIAYFTAVVTNAPTTLSSSLTTTVGQSVSLTTACSTGTPTWSTGQTVNTLTTSFSVAGTYSLSAACPTACGQQYVYGVTVNAVPIAPPTSPTVSGGTLVCQGSSLSAIVSCPAGSSLNWSTNSPFQPSLISSTFGLITIPGSASTGLYSYSLLCSNGSGTAATAYFVSVTPAPAPTVSSFSITAGQSISLSPTCATSIMWSDGSTSLSRVVSPTVTTSYTAVCAGQGGNCPTTTLYTVNVSVIAAPVSPTITLSKAVVCQGDPLTATVVCPTDVSSFTLNTNNTGTFTYSVICVSLSGVILGPPTTFSLTVNPIPAQPNFGSNLTVTQDGSLSLSNTAACAGTLVWGRIGGDFTSGTGLIPVSTSQTGAVSYTAICQSGECSSPVGFANVSVIAAPVSPTITLSKAVVCQGDPLTVTVVCGGASPSVSFTALNTNTTGTFTFTATCTSGSAVGPVGSVMYTIVARPVATLFASNSGTITCANPTVMLVASGGFTYSFSGPGLSQSGSASVATASQPGVYSVVAVNVFGCASTTTVTVTSNTLVPMLTVSNNTPVCEGQLYTITATSGFTSYSLLNPSNPAHTIGLFGTDGNPSQVSFNGQQPTGQPASVGPVTYTVVAQAANGCRAMGITTITIIPLPTATLMASGTLSCAQPSITLTASGGASYSLSNGQSNTSGLFVVNSPGIYSVVVSNGGVCTATATATVFNDKSVPTITGFTGGTLTCTQTSLILNASATAPGNLTYSVSGPGGFVQSNTTGVFGPIGSPGVYSLTVMSANGCFAVATTTVGSNTLLPIASLSVTNGGVVDCNNPVLFFTATGGISYQFYGPLGLSTTDNPMAANLPGSYSVVVTGTNGCTATASASVTSNTATPIGELTFVSPLTCARTTTTLIAFGGNTYSFAGPGLSQSGTSATALVSQAGMYSVVITGTNGCTASATTTILSNTAAPTASLTATGLLTCTSPTVTLLASGGVGYQFVGTGVVSTSGNIAVVNLPGTFSVIVTNANGCTATASASVTSNGTAPTASLTFVNPITCAQPNTTLIAFGGNTYSFAGPGLSQSGASQTAVASQAGVYSVVVTGPNGCTALASTTVLSNTTTPTASLTPGSATLTCANPSVLLVASGGVSYSFAGPGSFSASNNMALITQPGSYTVRVTAANGCTATATSTISSNTLAPMSSLAASGVLTCTNPVVTLTATGGNAYFFSSPGLSLSNTTGIHSVTASGTYSVLVTSSNGCTALASTTVAQNTVPPSASLLATNGGILTCLAPNVTLTVGGGLGYAFNGPGLSQTGPANTAMVSQTGVYSVLITGANGCTALTSTTIATNTNDLVQLSAAVSGTATCSQAATVTVTSNAVSYVFGVGTAQIGTSNLALVRSAGVYSVTGLSAGGCFNSTSFTVVEDKTPPAPTLTASGTITCVNLSATLTASGGVSYRIQGDGLSQSGATNQWVVSQPGLYSLTATAANGCTALVTSTVIGNRTPPSASLFSTNNINCNNSDAILIADGGVNYFFTGPGVDQNGSNNTVITGMPGLYSVQVTGKNGCLATASVTILGDFNAPAASLQVSGVLSCTLPTVVLTASGGGTYRFMGNGLNQPNSNNVNTVTVSQAGTYSVAVTGANGCSALATITALENRTIPLVSLTTTGMITCANPGVLLIASGGGRYTFTGPGLSQSGVSSTALVSQTGTYLVIVAGANGCTATTGTTVTGDTNPPTTTLVTTGTLTCANTSVTLTASGGRTYTLNGQTNTTGVFTVSAAGAYSVLVTGVNGCTAVALATVQSNTTLPTASLLATGTLTCANTSATLTASGGVSYLFTGSNLSQSGTSATALVSQAGTYSVIATGANSCTALATVSVTGSSSAPTASLVASGTITCAHRNATLTARGGVSYSLSNGQSNTTGEFVVSESGTYTVVLTGTNGCTAQANTTISSNTTVPNAGLVASGTLTCATNSISLSASGGVTYVLNNGQRNSTGEFVVSQAGDYTVMVTGVNGCTASASVSVLSEQVAQAITISGATTFCESQTGQLTVGGNGNILWNTGATTPVVSLSVSGIYSVTLTDSNGCVAIAARMVTAVSCATVAPPTPTPTGCGSPTNTIGQQLIITGVTDISCSTGTFRILTTGGNGNAVNFAGIVGLSNSLPFDCIRQVDGSNVVAAINNPNADIQPFKLRGSQVGGSLSNTFVFDFKQACVGTTPPSSTTTAPPTQTPPADPTPTNCGSPTNTIGQTLVIMGVADVNCATGTFRILTTGGNGQAINFALVSDLRSSDPYNCVRQVDRASIVEAINNPNSSIQPFGLRGLQINGSLSNTFVFDFKQACVGTTPPSSTTTAPPTQTPPADPTPTNCGSPTNTIGQSLVITGVGAVNCITGTFQILTTGGNGLPINFASIMGLSSSEPYNCIRKLDNASQLAAISNPNSDIQPFELRGVQVGGSSTGIFRFNFKQFCTGFARQAKVELANELTINVLGNPTLNDRATVDVQGTGNEPVTLRVSTSQGMVVSAQTVLPIGGVVHQLIELGRSAGVYLLQVSTPTQVKTVKIVRQ